MAEVHARVRGADYLTGLPRDRFTLETAIVIGGVNNVHPFREGNGRTQMEYLRQLGERAGYALDLKVIEPERWVAASRETSNGLYRTMQHQIERAVSAELDRDVIEAFERMAAGHTREHDRDGHER